MLFWPVDEVLPLLPLEDDVFVDVEPVDPVALPDGVGLGDDDGDGEGDGEGEGDGLGDGDVGLAATVMVSCFDAEPLPEQLRVNVVVPVRLPVLWLPLVPTEPIRGLIEQLEALPVDQESVALPL